MNYPPPLSFPEMVRTTIQETQQQLHRCIGILETLTTAPGFQGREQMDLCRQILQEQIRACAQLQDRSCVFVDEGPGTSDGEVTGAIRQVADEVTLSNVTLGSIREGVISVDAAGSVLLMNAMAGELTGWQPSLACGRNLGEVFPVADPRTHALIDNPIERILGANTSVEQDFILKNRSGERERIISCLAAPMGESSGRLGGTVFVFRDITQTRLMEDELFRARKLESVGVLAGGIAHDFNNILTGIVTNLFMAKTQLSPGCEVYELITEAEKAGFRASKLTKQLLTFAKGGTPVKENVAIREMIEDSVGFCLSGSNVDCKIDVADDVSMVEIDRGQIDQVLNNIIQNANEAMPQGGTITVRAENIEVSDTITTHTEMRLPLAIGTYVKISVADEGCGIAPENLVKIFDPYYTTKPKASGLGLTTVYSIIRKHGGLITARNNPGKGASFVFYLPASATSKSTQKAAKMTGQSKGRVLVMDDEQVIRIVVEKLLRKFGYDVVCVTNGTQAIDAYTAASAEQNPFDVVIMDLTIPGGMGGKEAVKKLLAIDPGARVIVASGYSSDPIMANYKDYGFIGVITKPFNIDEYLQVIDQVVTGKIG